MPLPTPDYLSPPPLPLPPHQNSCFFCSLCTRGKEKKILKTCFSGKTNWNIIFPASTRNWVLSWPPKGSKAKDQPRNEREWGTPRERGWVDRALSQSQPLQAFSPYNGLTPFLYWKPKPFRFCWVRKASTHSVCEITCGREFTVSDLLCVSEGYTMTFPGMMAEPLLGITLSSKKEEKGVYTLTQGRPDLHGDSGARVLWSFLE